MRNTTLILSTLTIFALFQNCASPLPESTKVASKSANVYVGNTGGTSDVPTDTSTDTSTSSADSPFPKVNGLSVLPMYRFAHPTGLRFYSLSQSEAAAAGFSVEGIAFKFVGGTGSAGTLSLYRCNGSDPFLSTHADCEGGTRQDTFAYGSLFIDPKDFASTPVHRYLNRANNRHIITVNQNEAAVAGLAYEGIIGFAPN